MTPTQPLKILYFGPSLVSARLRLFDDFIIAAQHLLKGTEGTESCADGLTLCKLCPKGRWLAFIRSVMQHHRDRQSVVFFFFSFSSFIFLSPDALSCGLLFAPSWG